MRIQIPQAMTISRGGANPAFDSENAENAAARAPNKTRRKGAKGIRLTASNCESASAASRIHRDCSARRPEQAARRAADSFNSR